MGISRLAFVAPLFLGGCFTYVPVEFATARVDSAVRAGLSHEGVEHVAELLGDERTSLRGRLLDVSPEQVVIAVATTPDARTPGSQITQPVRLSRRLVTDLEVRRLEGHKTALVVGTVSAVGLGLMFYALSVRDSPRGPVAPGGEADLARVPYR